MTIEDATIDRFTDLLKAVAGPTRRRILFTLRHTGEMSVGSIAKQVELSQPATSQHLRVLKQAGAIKSRKTGQQVYYRIFSIEVCDALTNFLVLYQEEFKKQKGQQ